MMTFDERDIARAEDDVAVQVLLPMRDTCDKHGDVRCFHYEDRRDLDEETIRLTVRTMIAAGWRPA